MGQGLRVVAEQLTVSGSASSASSPTSLFDQPDAATVGERVDRAATDRARRESTGRRGR